MFDFSKKDNSNQKHKTVLGLCGGVLLGTAACAFFQRKKERKWVDVNEDNHVSPFKENTNRGDMADMILSENIRQDMDDRKTMRNNNVLCIGGAGTGIGRRFVKPNILQMNASFVVTDPCGETVTSLGNILKENGYKIKVLNLADMTHSNRYNPLAYIRTDEYFEKNVATLIDCFLKDPSRSCHDDPERSLLSACIFHLFEHDADGTKTNFAGVFELLNEDLDQVFSCNPKDSLAYKYFERFKNEAGESAKGSIISCISRLAMFALPDVKNLTQYDELALEKMGDEKTALFVVTSQADKTFSFFVPMLYCQLFEALYACAEKMRHEMENGSCRLRYPVRCFMDEFANTGWIPDLPSRLVTMRPYNISVSIIIQDIGQLKEMYENEWKMICCNCDSLLFMGSSDDKTLVYISDRVGCETSGENNDKKQARKILTPEEVARIPNDKCIVFRRGETSCLDHKYPYEKHPYFKKTADGGGKLFDYKVLPEYNIAKEAENK